MTGEIGYNIMLPDFKSSSFPLEEDELYRSTGRQLYTGEGGRKG